jgi:Family of unknown function (DUF6427)
LLQYFRVNDPYRLLGLLVILLVFYLPGFVYSPDLTYPELRSIVVGEKVNDGNILYLELVDPVAPLAAWFSGLMDIVFGRSLLARHILAFFIIFLQSSYVGMVFANKRAFAENSYIPSLVSAILFMFSFDTICLTPELLGAGFLLPALNNLFKEIEFREQRDESIFNLGLYISLASLCSFSYSIYLVGVIITLIIFTRSTPRKYFLMIFGFLLPHLLLFSTFYLMDGQTQLLDYFYIPNLQIGSNPYISAGSVWILGALPLAFLFISIIMMNRDARFSKYQSQLVQCMFFWMVFSVLQILFSKDFRPQTLITLIPSLSFFVTHFFLLIRRKRIAEIYIWILLLGTISVSYGSRFNFLPGVSYSRLFVPDQKPIPGMNRVLVLDDDWSIYKGTSLATPFFNWKLSGEIFSHPHYYENVIQVYDGLLADPPDIIRDKNDLLRPFLDQIPELKNLYTKEGIYYTRKKVSN